VWTAVARLAGRQHGVISRSQLTALGAAKDAIRRWVTEERLYRVHRGVYAVGHEALTPKSRYLAAVYACGPGALLSHRAAGALQGLTSGAWVIEVTAARGCKPKPGITIHRSRLIHPDDRAEVEGIPTTSVARTFVDLADVLNDRQLTTAVRQADVLKIFDLTAIEATLDRLPGRTGRHRLNRVLAAYQPEPQLLRSDGERKLKRLCEQHNLPQPQFNVHVAGYEVDAYWPEAKLALEFDGAETHYTRHAFHQDRRRDRALAVEGIQTLRVTWPDLDTALADQVWEILRQR
jgi:very-short-patch-repair endonuclease